MLLSVSLETAVRGFQLDIRTALELLDAFCLRVRESEGLWRLLGISEAFREGGGASEQAAVGLKGFLSNSGRRSRVLCRSGLTLADMRADI